MLANWFDSVFGIFVEFHGFSFVISLALLESLHIDHVAGNDIGDKNYFTIRGFCHRNAFCTCIKDFYVIKNDLVCVFLCHSAKISL